MRHSWGVYFVSGIMELREKPQVRGLDRTWEDGRKTGVLVDLGALLSGVRLWGSRTGEDWRLGRLLKMRTRAA
jgi:hypothetical protein